MELMDFAMLGMVAGGFSLVFSVICAYGTLYLRDRRVAILEQDVQRLTMQRNQEISSESRNQKKARKAEAFAALGAAIQGGNSWQDAIKKVGLSYPDVAMEFAEKIM